MGPERQRSFVVMVTTDSGQDIVAAPLCRGGATSIASARLGAERARGPSGDVLRRTARITSPAGLFLRSSGSCAKSVWKPPVLWMWSVSDIRWVFACMVTLSIVALEIWCAPCAGWDVRNDFSYTLEHGYGGTWRVLCKVRRTRRLQRLPALNAHHATSITIKEPASWTAARHKKECVCFKNGTLMELPLSN
ncbi:uncharacterized protein LOC144102382 [Amblyomma americanum]